MSVNEKLAIESPTFSIPFALNLGQRPLRKCNPGIEGIGNCVSVHLEQEEIDRGIS